MSRNCIVKEPKTLDKVIEADGIHEDQPFKIPGVNAISGRPKATRATRTTEFAVVAHAAEEIPASELKPNDVMSPTIDGVGTDVVAAAALVFLQSTV
jgi:hypothetical protein